MKRGRLTLMAAVVVTAAGCASAQGGAAGGSEGAATARLLNAQGVQIGVAELEQEGSAVEVEISVSGLTPGVHGIHFHTVGTCTGPDFMSAGGHFNPGQRQHGFDNPQGFHAGDLRNLEVGANGKGSVEFQSPNVSLGTGSTSLLDADGTAIVIHATADDYRTDPSGNSGARIACGVIAR